MAQGTPNQALRAARESLAYSQADFAMAINRSAQDEGVTLRCDARQVAKWEAGEVRWPQPRYQRALEAVTGLSCVALGFTPPGSRDDLEDPVQRRDFLGLGVAAALGTVPITALAGHGRRLPDGYIEDTHRTLGQLQDLERRFGSESLLPLVEAQVDELAKAMDDGAESPGLLAAAAWAHMLAGWMNFDAGQHRRSRSLYKEAYFISEMAGDRSMAARTAAAMSMHAARLGRPGDAVRLARMGAEQLPKRGRAAALLVMREARGWSLAGAHREAKAAVHRAMDAHTSGPLLPWAEFFSEGELTAGAGQIAGDLQDWAEAEALSSRALSDPSLPPRTRASFGLYRAESIARGGDASAAIGAVAEIMPTLGRLSSARVRRQVTSALAVLPQDDPQVTRWREEMAESA